MKEKELSGKVIVVSGGTKGVGRAAAEEFARRGARVVIGGRDEEAARSALETIKSYGSEGHFVHTDLEKVADCRKLVGETLERFGRIDGLFIYAGITPISPLDSCDEATFDRVMDINFKAAFFCVQEALEPMIRQGGGSIVFTGSAHAWGGEKDRAAYACSKGVLKTLMEHIARNYARERIRCNYLTLGWTPTEGELALRRSQGESEAGLRQRAEQILPMGRMLETGDYLEALVYLMSDASAMMSGSVLRITGGEYIS